MYFASTVEVFSPTRSESICHIEVDSPTCPKCNKVVSPTLTEVKNIFAKVDKDHYPKGAEESYLTVFPVTISA